MDFREISAFFGGTIFAEEYRVDFKRIGDKLRSLVSEAVVSSSLQDEAPLLLLQSIDAAMRGEIATAEQYLNDLYKLADAHSDERWKSRCVNYQFYVLLQKRIPPYLRFRRDLNSDSGTLKTRGLNLARDSLSQQRLRSIDRGWTELDKLESDVIINHSRFVDNLWRFAHPTHPCHPTPPWHSKEDTATLAIVSRSTEPYPARDVRAAQRLGLHETAGYLNRLTLEWSIGRGSEASSSDLASLCETYLAKNDFTGAANCKLIKGDTAVSPPFTSPIALNLITLDDDLGWDNDNWDTTEAQYPLRRNENANADYQAAYDLFAEGGSKRGKGAVQIRHGCIDHIAAMDAARAGNSQQASSLFHSAASHLEEAIGFFEGDSINIQITRTHQLLLQISLGKKSGILEDASRIGDWGANSHNHGVTEFLGLLMLRFGRLVFLTSMESASGRFKAALCCACATACFASLNDPLLELRAIIAHSSLLNRLGGTRLSEILLREGFSVFIRAMQRLDEMANSIPPVDKYLGTVESIRFNVWLRFHRVCQNILGSSAPTPCPHVSGANAALADGIRQSLVSLVDVTSDYHRAVRNRHIALIENADVEIPETFLMNFLLRLDSFNPAALDQILVAELRIAVFNYLGDFDKARQVLDNDVPMFHEAWDTASPLQSIFSLANRAQSHLAWHSIARCFLSKDWNRGLRELEQVKNVFPQFPRGLTLENNDDLWQAHVWIASIYEHNGRFNGAYEEYSCALQLINQRRQTLLDPDARRSILNTTYSGELFAGLARISNKAADSKVLASGMRLQVSSWQDQVLFYLEQWRSRAVVDLLMVEKHIGTNKGSKLRELATNMFQVRQADQASKLSPEQRDLMVEQLAAELGLGHSDVFSVLAVLEQASFAFASNLDQANSEINPKSLYSGIPADNLCIHINLSRDGLLLLSITPSGIEHIHLSDVTDFEFERTVLRFLNLLDNGRAPKEETYMPMLKQLSTWILDPVAPSIRHSRGILFVPSRSLHRFPFSALLLDDKPLFLQKGVWQVPSLTTLAYLAEKSQKYEALLVSVLTNPNRHDESGNDIHLAGMEAVNIARIYKSLPQFSGSLSHEDFGKLYEASDIVHVASHGVQNAESAWQSYIPLQEKFQVHDLAKLRSKAALVVFGSCVSGLGEHTIGNDMLGFSHAVLASGASSFLGGLWGVDDLASMLLLIFFHRNIVKRENNLAECFRQAQVELYQMNQSTTKATLEQLLAEWKEAENQNQIPSKINRQARYSIEYAIDEIDLVDTDFTHPRFWAPFVLVGHGGLYL